MTQLARVILLVHITAQNGAAQIPDAQHDAAIIDAIAFEAPVIAWLDEWRRPIGGHLDHLPGVTATQDGHVLGINVAGRGLGKDWPPFGRLLSLERLDVSSNNLGPAAPPELGETNLRVLVMTDNPLHDEIPIAWGALRPDTLLVPTGLCLPSELRFWARQIAHTNAEPCGATNPSGEGPAMTTVAWIDLEFSALSKRPDHRDILRFADGVVEVFPGAVAEASAGRVDVNKVAASTIRIRVDLPGELVEAHHFVPAKAIEPPPGFDRSLGVVVSSGLRDYLGERFPPSMTPPPWLVDNLLYIFSDSVHAAALAEGIHFEEAPGWVAFHLPHS